MVNAFTTLSTGYDSTAASCIAKRLGINSCFTGNALDRRIHILRREKDDGTLVANKLELEINYLDSRRSTISENELYFLAANYPKFSDRDSTWNELSLHSMTQYIGNKCKVAAVFTGYHGDVLWGRKINENYLDDKIKCRGTVSGLGLTEIRLKSGFINIPVPYIMARNIKDIHKISCSNEMEPWRLNTSYDRPIPRRIAEQCGIERNLFGTRKKHITQNYFWPRNKKLKKLFLLYLEENKISAKYIYFYYAMNIIRDVFKVKPINKKGIDFYFLMHQWATYLLAKKTEDILKNKC